MNITPIKTEAENDTALVFSALIRQFEDAHYTFDKPAAIAG